MPLISMMIWTRKNLKMLTNRWRPNGVSPINITDLIPCYLILIWFLLYPNLIFRIRVSSVLGFSSTFLVLRHIPNRGIPYATPSQPTMFYLLQFPCVSLPYHLLFAIYLLFLSFFLFSFFSFSLFFFLLVLGSGSRQNAETRCSTAP